MILQIVEVKSLKPQPRKEIWRLCLAGMPQNYAIYSQCRMISSHIFSTFYFQSFILFGDNEDLNRFHEAYETIKYYLRKGYVLHYVWTSLLNVDSLLRHPINIYRRIDVKSGWVGACANHWWKPRTILSPTLVMNKDLPLKVISRSLSV